MNTNYTYDPGLFKITDVSQRNCKKKVFYYRRSVWKELINKAQDKSVVINRKNVSIKKGILTVNNKQNFFVREKARGDNGLFITQVPKVLQ